MGIKIKPLTEKLATEKPDAEKLITIEGFSLNDIIEFSDAIDELIECVILFTEADFFPANEVRALTDLKKSLDGDICNLFGLKLYKD